MAITSIEGERLVGSHCAGDPSAFPAIVKAHYPALLARARYRLQDPQSAEDAVQEALLRAYRSLPRFGGFGEFHLTAWLYRILENVCIDEANRRRRAAEVVERLAAQPEEVVPDASSSARLPNSQVRDAIAELPAPYRDALIQREVKGLSYADMAAESGITEDNARARVSRARSALRRLLGPIVATVAWLAGTTRRGERVLLDGTTQAAASSPAAAAVAPAAVHLPGATQFISQVATVVPESQVASVVKIATAAVIAVALPVGGANVVSRSAPPPTSPHSVEMRQSDDPLSAASEAETTDSNATTTAEDIAVGLFADAGWVPTVAPGEPEAEPEAEVEEEPAAARGQADPADEEPTDGTTGTTEPEGSQPTDGEGADSVDSAIVIDGSAADRLALEDGRSELTGPVTLTTSVGELTARLSLLCSVPSADDGEAEEYRLVGSILATGESGGRIRLAGALEAWTVDEDGMTTYIFSGRYSTNDEDALGLAPKGAFTASFNDSWRLDLTVRLLPNRASPSRA